MQINGLKSILETFNKGASADPHEIELQIKKLCHNKTAAESEIKKIEAAKPELSLAEDFNGLDDLDKKILVQRRIIAGIDLALPFLQEQLAAARISEYKAGWLARREPILKALRVCIVTSREAGEAYRHALGLMEAAGAAGFSKEISHLPKPPGLFRLDEYPLTTVEAFAQAIEHGWNVQAIPPKFDAPPAGSQFFHDGVKAAQSKPSGLAIIPHGSPGKGPTRLRQVPAATQSAKPAPAAKALPPKPAAPLEPPPAPVRPKPDADGCGSITVLRRGFSTGDGAQHAIGKVLKLPFAEAEAAVRSGTADFVARESLP